MKLYCDYVVETMNQLIEEAGGMRKLSRILKIDVSIISKTANGKLIPTPDTFGKWIGRNITTKLYIEE